MYVHGPEKIILLKWQQFQKWSTNLKQSLSKSQLAFCRNRQAHLNVHVEIQGVNHFGDYTKTTKLYTLNGWII